LKISDKMHSFINKYSKLSTNIGISLAITCVDGFYV
jgi:hypothetical protein